MKKYTDTARLVFTEPHGEIITVDIKVRRRTPHSQSIDEVKREYASVIHRAMTKKRFSFENVKFELNV